MTSGLINIFWSVGTFHWSFFEDLFRPYFVTCSWEIAFSLPFFPKCVWVCVAHSCARLLLTLRRTAPAPTSERFHSKVLIMYWLNLAQSFRILIEQHKSGAMTALFSTPHKHAGSTDLPGFKSAIPSWTTPLRCSLPYNKS